MPKKNKKQSPSGDSPSLESLGEEILGVIGGGDAESEGEDRSRDNRDRDDEDSDSTVSTKPREKNSRKKSLPKSVEQSPQTESESEVESDDASPTKKSSLKKRTSSKDRSTRDYRDRDRDRERDRDRDRDRERERERDRDRERERDRDRDRDNRDRDRKQERDNDRDREGSRRGRGRDKEREKDTERERTRGRDNDLGRRKERKSTSGKKKSSDKNEKYEVDDDIVDDFDDDLMGDEDDRRYLDSLPELERERIISERYEQRTQARELRQLQKKLDSSSTSSTSSSTSSSHSSSHPSHSSHSSSHSSSSHSTLPPLPKYATSTSSVRGSGRTEQRKADKAAAMSELKARRATKQRMASPSRDDDDYSDAESDSNSDKSPRERASSPPSETDLADNDEADLRKELKYTLSDLNSVRLSRNLIISWIDEPFFDKELVGFYVRVGIGFNDNKEVYRMGEIVGVQERPATYDLGNKKRTNKVLEISHAGHSKTFQIKFISNQNITEEEHQKWADSMKQANLSLPKKSDVLILQKSLQNLQNFHYRESDITMMLEKRKEQGQLYVKKTKRRAEIAVKLKTAREMDDWDKVEQFEQELKELDELDSDKYESHPKLKEINRKNSEVNINIDRMRKFSEERTAGEADPFSRRPTKPQIFVFKKGAQDPAKEATEAEKSKPTEENNTSNDNKIQDSQQSDIDEIRKSGDALNTSFGDEQPVHHDLDLEIDINIAKAAANKTTSIPATSLKRPSNLSNEIDTRQSKRTLSLDDYKRRRGLI